MRCPARPLEDQQHRLVLARDRMDSVQTLVLQGNPASGLGAAEGQTASEAQLVAGQWQKTGDGFDLVICENETGPSLMRAASTTQPPGWPSR